MLGTLFDLSSAGTSEVIGAATELYEYTVKIKSILVYKKKKKAVLFINRLNDCDECH